MLIENKINQVYICLGQEDKILYIFNLNIFFLVFEKKIISIENIVESCPLVLLLSTVHYCGLILLYTKNSFKYISFQK